MVFAYAFYLRAGEIVSARLSACAHLDRRGRLLLRGYCYTSGDFSSRYAPGPCCPRIDRQNSFTTKPACNAAVKAVRVAARHSRASGMSSCSIRAMSPGISMAIRWRKIAADTSASTGRLLPSNRSKGSRCFKASMDSARASLPRKRASTLFDPSCHVTQSRSVPFLCSRLEVRGP